MYMLWKVTLEGNPLRNITFKETVGYFETEMEADCLLDKNPQFAYTKGERFPALIMKKCRISPFVDEDLAKVMGIIL